MHARLPWAKCMRTERLLIVRALLIMLLLRHVGVACSTLHCLLDGHAWRKDHLAGALELGNLSRARCRKEGLCVRVLWWHHGPLRLIIACVGIVVGVRPLRERRWC